LDRKDCPQAERWSCNIKPERLDERPVGKNDTYGTGDYFRQCREVKKEK